MVTEPSSSPTEACSHTDFTIHGGANWGAALAADAAVVQGGVSIPAAWSVFLPSTLWDVRRIASQGAPV